MAQCEGRRTPHRRHLTQHPPTKLRPPMRHRRGFAAVLSVVPALLLSYQHQFSGLAFSSARLPPFRARYRGNRPLSAPRCISLVPISTFIGSRPFERPPLGACATLGAKQQRTAQACDGGAGLLFGHRRDSGALPWIGRPAEGALRAAAPDGARVSSRGSSPVPRRHLRRPSLHPLLTARRPASPGLNPPAWSQLQQEEGSELIVLPPSTTGRVVRAAPEWCAPPPGARRPRPAGAAGRGS